MAKNGEKFDVTTATLTAVHESDKTVGTKTKMYLDLITWYLHIAFSKRIKRPPIKPPLHGTNYQTWRKVWAVPVEQVISTHYYQHNDGAILELGSHSPDDVADMYSTALDGMLRAIKLMREQRLTIDTFLSLRVVWVDNLESWFPVESDNSFGYDPGEDMYD